MHAKRARWRVGTWASVLLIAASALIAPASTAAVIEVASTGGCFRASCNNQDPVGLCDGDAITVASKSVDTPVGYAGQLDLRYSPSCQANWGRFTAAYGKEALKQLILGRLTGGTSLATGGSIYVWNPGGERYDRARSAASTSSLLTLLVSSTWSKMTNGDQMACVGLDLAQATVQSKKLQDFGSDIGSAGWYSGPCV